MLLMTDVDSVFVNSNLVSVRSYVTNYLLKVFANFCDLFSWKYVLPEICYFVHCCIVCCPGNLV